MSTEQHEAMKLAENIDEFSGYCTGFAAKTIRTQHALIVQMAEHADPDASECESCAGQGWYWQEHQVAERATDVQTFKTDCEACSGIGFVGPDAEFKRALAAATQYLKGPKT